MNDSKTKLYRLLGLDFLCFFKFYSVYEKEVLQDLGIKSNLKWLNFTLISFIKSDKIPFLKFKHISYLYMSIYLL